MRYGTKIVKLLTRPHSIIQRRYCTGINTQTSKIAQDPCSGPKRNLYKLSHIKIKSTITETTLGLHKHQDIVTCANRK